MLVLLIISIVLGAVVAGITGVDFLFWVVAVFVFICGLPGVLITGFIDGIVDYTQDRADYRHIDAEINADRRFFEEQLRREEEVERILYELHGDPDDDDEPDIYIDNRQVHFHSGKELK